MKQFVFSLQSLYDIKLSEEKQQKIALLTIEKELQARKEELKQLGQQFDIAKCEYCEVVAVGIEAVRVKQYGHFFSRLKAAMVVVKEQITAVELRKEQCVNALVELRKEKKLLDTMREEQYAGFLKERKKQQEALINDIVSFKTTTS